MGISKCRKNHPKPASVAPPAAAEQKVDDGEDDTYYANLMKKYRTDGTEITLCKKCEDELMSVYDKNRDMNNTFKIAHKRILMNCHKNHEQPKPAKVTPWVIKTTLPSY